MHIETWKGIKKDVPVKIDIIPVEKIEIKDTTDYLFSNTIDKSEKVSISAKVNPSNATYKDIEWNSSDSNVIGIENDKFKIQGTGNVILTCSAHGGVKSSMKITVINRNLIVFISFSFIAGTIATIGFFIRKKHKNKQYRHFQNHH